MKSLAFAALLFVASCSTAQTDNKSLLSETEMKLKSKSVNVSDILTDKKYISIHPDTDFRNLIQKYCNAGMVSIATDDEPGTRIRVVGTIKNKSGQPVANALVYLYQTDSKGWYSAEAPHITGNEGDTRHARLFGYVRTGADGRFELHTVKPSGYPQSDLPAHIHVHVMADGYNTWVSEFLFDDDPRLKGRIREQAISNRFIIANPEMAKAPFQQQFSYSVEL